jgi:hypothetical protein
MYPRSAAYLQAHSICRRWSCLLLFECSEGGLTKGRALRHLGYGEGFPFA